MPSTLNAPPPMLINGWTPAGWERAQLRRQEISAACDWHDRICMPPRARPDSIERRINGQLSPGRRGALLASLRDQGYPAHALWFGASAHALDRLYREVNAWLERNPSGLVPVMVTGTKEQRDARRRLIEKEAHEIKLARDHYGRHAVRSAVTKKAFFRGATCYARVDVCRDIQTLRQFIYCLAARLEIGPDDRWVDWATMTLANKHFGYWPVSASKASIAVDGTPSVWCRRLIKGKKTMPMRKVQLTPLGTPD